MWPSASSSDHPEHFVIIGSPDSRRVALFQSALAWLKLPPAQVVPYLDLLSGRADLSALVRRGAVVRIESPGKDFDLERALLVLGATVSDDADDAGDGGDAGEAGEAGENGYARLSREAAGRLTFDRGRILYPRQWYLGYRELLRLIERRLAECPFHHLMNSPAEIAAMFDKKRCYELLSLKGLPVPPGLGVIKSFDELVERMRRRDCRRVFVKLAHGSSASGVVAYRTDGRRHQATTTVEMEQFPASLYGGVDLLIAPGFRSQAVAEINAFGDLLPGIRWEGQETYTSEILAIREKGLGRCSTREA